MGSVRMASTLPRLGMLEAIASHPPESIAVAHYPSGREFTYNGLLHDIAEARYRLHETVERRPLEGERIAFMVENSYEYVVTLLAIISSDAIALPLCPTFPASELRYILNQSQTSLLLSSKLHQAKMDEVRKEGIEREVQTASVPDLIARTELDHDIMFHQGLAGKGGMMLYTSGTTNRPKGVLLSTSVLTAQSRSLLKAWSYTSSDRLLHVLPLHHIHGTVNALLTPLLAGSTIEFMYPFNADACWKRLAAPFFSDPLLASAGEKAKEEITFFTAVPTIYNRLLQSHPNLPMEIQRASQEAISPQNLRLNISGSAALPVPTKKAWTILSHGNVLLERYGMTEVGMALSCGLSFSDRVDGSVGWPLPSVEARLVDTETHEVIQSGEEVSADGKERHGEIQLRGPTIFKGYWRNPEATAAEFVDASDGGEKWFKTGDVAVRRTVSGAGKSDQPWAQGPMYFIMGRKSADIIKTGGEKVSALEIERELLSLPEIAECAVVGLPSEAWGQKVACVVMLSEKGKTAGKSGKPWGAMDMRRALKDLLVNYKVPQEMKVVETIPRNAMGKINKKALVREIWPDLFSDNVGK